MRARVGFLISALLLSLVLLVRHIHSTKHATNRSASTTPSPSDATWGTLPTKGSARSTSDSAATNVYAHNLMLRKGQNFRVYVRCLRGQMVRTRHTINPTFDDPESFVLDVKAGVIRAAVGDITNFLNAIHAENRLILNNGSHRAFALREIGVTHAPCIIQYVSSREELDVVAPTAVRKNPAVFLEHPRPALLKDYCDPELRTIIPSRRRLRQVTVKFQVEEGYIPAL